MVVEDLLSILKNEVANKKNKNVDILSLSSQICLKLNGRFFFFFLTIQSIHNLYNNIENNILFFYIFY